MNFKLAVSSLVLGFSVFACAVESTDPADAEEADSTESDMVANAQKLAGSFTLVPGIGAPTMQGIVFNANGTFFADVDTGIRCFRAPCPSNVRMTGRFAETGARVEAGLSALENRIRDGVGSVAEQVDAAGNRLSETLSGGASQIDRAGSDAAARLVDAIDSRATTLAGAIDGRTAILTETTELTYGHLADRVESCALTLPRLRALVLLEVANDIETLTHYLAG